MTLASCRYYEDDSHQHHDVGYSYAKFSGPVSAPEHEITVEGHHGKHAKDYVGHPSYQFEYGVEDPKTKVSQSRKEHRNGDEVHGEYSVVEPNGKLRTVKYTADKHNGFQAEVLIDGKPLYHELEAEHQKIHEQQQQHHHQQQPQQHYEPAPQQHSYESSSYGGNDQSDEEHEHHSSDEEY